MLTMYSKCQKQSNQSWTTIFSCSKL